MDLFYTLMLWAHFLGLALGGAAAFGHPVLGAVGAATPEARPHMMRASRVLTMLGRAGLALLVISGVVMMAQRFEAAAMPASFWIKMLLVMALIVNVVMAGLAARAAAAGDAGRAGRLPTHARISAALLVLLVLFAVLAFG